MKGYMYEFEITNRGYVEQHPNEMTDCELQKYNFVENYLCETLQEANCGWKFVQYKVMETPSGMRTEFLVLWAEDVGNSGSRWINVTGDSLGSIMCSMCDNLW